MARRGWSLYLLLGALLALSIHHFAVSASEYLRTGFVDLPIFLRQAASYLLGGELYTFGEQPQTFEPGGAVYKFPPLFAMLLLPEVRYLSPHATFVVHWAIQIVAYGLAVFSILRGAARERGLTFAFVLILVALNFEPFHETLWRLQLETYLLLLLAIAILALERGRDALAGSALGIAVALKLYPVFLLVYLVVRRRFTALLWAGVAFLLVAVSALIVIGMKENRTYYFEVLPYLLAEQPLATSENVGLGRYLQLLPGITPMGAKRLVQLFTLPVLFGSLWLIHRRRTPAPALELSTCIALMLIVMPNVWVNYQVLLLIPLAAVLDHGSRPERQTGPLVAAWVAFGILLFYWPCHDLTVSWPCAQTPYFLGLVQLPRALHDFVVELRGLPSLLLWLACLWLLERTRRKSCGGDQVGWRHEEVRAAGGACP